MTIWETKTPTSNAADALLLECRTVGSEPGRLGYRLHVGLIGQRGTLCNPYAMADTPRQRDASVRKQRLCPVCWALGAPEVSRDRLTVLGVDVY